MSKNSKELQGLQLRHFPIQDFKVRQEDDGTSTVSGVFIPYGVLSERLGELGGARERIEPAAFRRSVSEDDVRLLINHNPSLILGRTRSGTLQLTDEARGVFGESKLADQSYARDLVIAMRRRDIDQASFGFIVEDAVWETVDGEEIHVVKSARLKDVSIVTFPAYPQTLIQARAVAEALTRTERTEDDVKLLKTFSREIANCVGCGCEKKKVSVEKERQSLNTSEGQNAEDGDGLPSDKRDAETHDARRDVDIVAAREMRKRELDLFEIEA